MASVAACHLVATTSSREFAVDDSNAMRTSSMLASELSSILPHANERLVNFFPITERVCSG